MVVQSDQGLSGVIFSIHPHMEHMRVTQWAKFSNSWLPQTSSHLELIWRDREREIFTWEDITHLLLWSYWDSKETNTIAFGDREQGGYRDQAFLSQSVQLVTLILGDRCPKVDFIETTYKPSLCSSLKVILVVLLSRVSISIDKQADFKNRQTLHKETYMHRWLTWEGQELDV